MLEKKGFTLIELLVVIIIVGILASVSIPMMRTNIKRAQATEAIAALGAIRTQLRLVHTEHDSYTGNPSNPIGTGAVVGQVPGFGTGSLNSKYFSDNDYQITAISPDAFTVMAIGASSGGTSGTDMSGVAITIYETGIIDEDYNYTP